MAASYGATERRSIGDEPPAPGDWQAPSNRHNVAPSNEFGGLTTRAGEMVDQDRVHTEGPRPVPGLLFACTLNGTGGGKQVDAEEAGHLWPRSAGGVLWLHLDRTVDEVADWLRRELGASEATVELLLSHETRPLTFREGEALITILRGINLNPNSAPEDMIALQIWADEGRVVTLRRRPLQTPRTILAKLTGPGGGPRTPGDLVSDLAEILVKNMAAAIFSANARIDELEQRADNGRDDGKILREITSIRRNCLALQRFMSPQHDALTEAERYPPEWFSEANKTVLARTTERLDRYLDDLQVTKESAVVLQDDVSHQADANMNRTMYMLSIVAAIFLPLSFVTGLLGINVGGMPGVDDGTAFWVTVVVLLGLTGLEFWIFKRLKWL